MNEYEQRVYEELQEWKREINKKPRIINRLSKQVQRKITHYIPEKIHLVLTEAMKNMVKATLVGSNWTTKKNQTTTKLSLQECDELVQNKIAMFRKTATIEGAGTGAGGIFLGLADFPLLLSIKMKLLHEIAAIYGFDPSEYEERLYILYVFQLAFSSDETRKVTLDILEHWETNRIVLRDVDWREFQQEYRDYIDLAKLLQLVPGIGAAVGAYANYQLLDQLGVFAMNAFRLRILKA